MKKEFESLKTEFTTAIKKVDNRDSLENLRVEFLGRKGKMSSLMKKMSKLSDQERKSTGALSNQIKEELEKGFLKKEAEFSRQEEEQRAEKEWIDVTEPGDWPSEGHLHPTSTAIAEISDIFSRIGFTRSLTPDVDWDYYAFESLNMPKDHPARDDWETFFVAKSKTQTDQGKKGKIVLTPHTSNSQVREMEKGVLPIRMVNINRCYRRQASVTHLPMFHQFEGLMVDKDLTIANLKGVLDYFVQQYFGPERVTRLRPHHFRFTEPSFEVDISCGACVNKDTALCRVCKAGWLELGGAGMVHPNVLKAGKIDSEEYTGFAFGWGVERCLMMRAGTKIDDIRVFYKNDLRFINQF